MKTTRVYICSSLKPRNVERVNKLLASLIVDRPDLRVFRPCGTDPATMMDTVREDVREIEKCDELWVCGRYGRDSSLEIGMALALKKKIKIYRDHTNNKKLNDDEMWKIGIERKLVEIIDL